MQLLDELPAGLEVPSEELFRDRTSGFQTSEAVTGHLVDLGLETAECRGPFSEPDERFGHRCERILGIVGFELLESGSSEVGHHGSNPFRGEFDQILTGLGRGGIRDG